MGARRAIVLLVCAATCAAAGCGALVSIDDFELAPSSDDAGSNGTLDTGSDAPSDALDDSRVNAADATDPPCPTCQVLVPNLSVGPEAHVAVTTLDVHYTTALPNGGLFKWSKSGGPPAPSASGDFRYVVADDAFVFGAKWSGSDWSVVKPPASFVPLANTSLKGMAITSANVYLGENSPSGADLHSMTESTMSYGAVVAGNTPYATLRQCGVTYCYAYTDGSVYRAGTAGVLASGQGTVTDIAGDDTYVYWVTPSDIRFFDLGDAGVYKTAGLISGVRRIAFRGAFAYFLSPTGLHKTAAGSQATTRMVSGTDFYALAVDDTWVYVLSSTALWRVPK